MNIPEPRLTADLEDPEDQRDERCWHGDALRMLARQLGVMNDFYFPLLGAATLIDGRTLTRTEVERRWPDLQKQAPSE